MKKLTLLILTLFACFAAFANEEKPEAAKNAGEEKHAVAIEVVNALTSHKLDEETFRKSMIERFDKDPRKANMDPEAAKELRAALVEAFNGVTNERLIAMLAKPYEEQFSIEELRAIRDFYKSDAGKSLIQKNEAILKAQEDGKRLMAQELFQEMRERQEKK